MQIGPPNPTHSIQASLKGQVALVTGGGRGIGAATAARFARLGARVVIVSRTASEVKKTIEQIRSETPGAQIEGLSLDLSRVESTKTLFDFAEKCFSVPVQILVNNAAIGYALPFIASSGEVLASEWEKIQSINIRTPLLLSHEMMKRLSYSALPGSIVNLSSLGGVSGTEKFPGLALYVTSKAAVIGMTEALAVEGKSIGVRVNAVAPGAVDTEMLRKAAPHLKTNTKPEDIAEIILSLCASTDTGKVIEVHSNL